MAMVAMTIARLVVVGRCSRGKDEDGESFVTNVAI